MNIKKKSWKSLDVSGCQRLPVWEDDQSLMRTLWNFLRNDCILHMSSLKHTCLHQSPISLNHYLLFFLCRSLQRSAGHSGCSYLAPQRRLWCTVFSASHQSRPAPVHPSTNIAGWIQCSGWSLFFEQEILRKSFYIFKMTYLHCLAVTPFTLLHNTIHIIGSYALNIMNPGLSSISHLSQHLQRLECV